MFLFFDYIDQALIVLSVASGRVSIMLFTSIVGSPVGTASVSLTLFFSRTTEIAKKLLNITRNKNKKHDKILMLAKSKLNSIETLVSQALIDMEISHEEFITILKEKDKYEKMKDNLKNKNEKYEIMRLSSVKSKTFIFLCVCMYKMVVEIRKQTWEKRSIKTVKHCHKKRM